MYDLADDSLATQVLHSAYRWQSSICSRFSNVRLDLWRLSSECPTHTLARKEV